MGALLVGTQAGAVGECSVAGPQKVKDRATA